MFKLFSSLKKLIMFSVVVIISIASFSQQKETQLQPQKQNLQSYQTYYVRVDGGTNTQCTGLVDAPYPGSGDNQPCAWSHPFYAINQDGNWILKGGDTLYIHSGSYKMGYGGADLTSTLCAQDYTWDCHLPPLPSGPDPSHPTRIVGEGYENNCSSSPQLWGAERATTIIDLTNTSNAVVDCLEITDHSSCASYHCDSSVACQRDNYPYGDYADVGIEASYASNITLKNLNIHGLAMEGIHGGGITNLTMENVRISGNGFAGWDGDVGENSSFSGNINLKNVVVEWNGCPESYPSMQPSNCWGQNTCGGYGDGVGMARSGGNWLIEDSIFRYNVSDGLDLLYVGVDHPDSFVRLERCYAYGNAGNQFKVGGESQLINCFAISNCSFFYNKPFGRYMGGLDSGDNCRAGGASLSINLPKGKKSYIINSTIGSEGWATAELQCNNLDFPDQPACDGSERVYIFNNIFYGSQVVYLDYERLSDFIGDGDPYHFTSSDTIDNNTIYNCYIYDNLGLGSYNIFQDPLVANGNMQDFDGHLTAGSPAIDKGLPVGSVNGLVPSTDIEGSGRSGAPDLGAYEYQGTSVCTLSCYITVPSTAVIGTPVNFSSSASPSSVCSGSVSFLWDFGDGSTSTEQNPVHTYSSQGNYNFSLTAAIENVTCTKHGSISITQGVTPPSISSVTKKGSPFRLIVMGDNFHPNCIVRIDGNAVPSTSYKSANKVVAKGGATLKAMVPVGTTVAVTVKNTDDGGISQPFYYTR
jgi:hypothetical protein